MDVPVKKPQDNGQKTLISNDILAKRLKNRERQRRYRERKRLKADSMKMLGTNQLASLPVEVPVIVASQDSAPPVNIAPLDYLVPVKVAPLGSSMPVNVAPLESSVPVKVAPLGSSMPVNGVPLESSVPVKVAPLGSSMPVNVAPGGYVMPVDVASGECVKPVNVAPRVIVTRVYSGRNWKREARNAYAARQKEVSTNSTVSPNLPHVEQSDVAFSSVLSSSVTASENNGTPKSILSRRNWKTEARNKKS